MQQHPPVPSPGDHSPGEPGKPGKVGEFQSGEGKVRENGKKSEEAKSVEIAVKILVSLHMHYILFHVGVI